MASASPWARTAVAPWARRSSRTSSTRCSVRGGGLALRDHVDGGVQVEAQGAQGVGVAQADGGGRRAQVLDHEGNPAVPEAGQVFHGQPGARLMVGDHVVQAVDQGRGAQLAFHQDHRDPQLAQAFLEAGVAGVLQGRRGQQQAVDAVVQVAADGDQVLLGLVVGEGEGEFGVPFRRRLAGPLQHLPEIGAVGQQQAQPHGVRRPFGLADGRPAPAVQGDAAVEPPYQTLAFEGLDIASHRDVGDPQQAHEVADPRRAVLPQMGEEQVVPVRREHHAPPSELLETQET